MIDNLKDLFEEQHTFYLNKAEYVRLAEPTELNVGLVCNDSVEAKKENEHVKLIYKRSVGFRPECLYKIEVEFGAELTIKPDKKGLLDDTEVDLQAEFIQNGAFVLSNLISRASHLIGDLSASFGQQPIITPPTILNK